MLDLKVNLLLLLTVMSLLVCIGITETLTLSIVNKIYFFVSLMFSKDAYI